MSVAAVPLPSASPGDWRILVIDDSPEDRAEVRRLLSKGSPRRYTFVEAQTVAAGLRTVRAGPVFDCVILDYHLPDGTAPDLLAQLVTPEGGLLCPVVVLTGQDLQSLGRNVLRAGAQDFVGKAWMTAESLTRAAENAVERWALAAELRSALEKAERAVRARDQLVSLVSHDLRDPLSALATGIALLQKQAPDANRTSLERMARQARRMEDLIDELLDAAQLQAGKALALELGETELVGLAREIVQEHQRATSKHRLDFRSSAVSLCGEWDRKRLARVINNLLSNAIKYSPGGGVVRVEVEAAEAGWASLRIVDEGIGIDESDRARIFDWYARGDNARHSAIPGTGIGLAGARDIVAQLGGAIAVASERGHGSTFTVRIPTAATQKI